MGCVHSDSCGHQDGWGCFWGLRRGIAGCRAWAWAADSLASLAVWTCCILYQDCWGSPSTQPRSHSSLTDGLSCSFIRGFLPWACIYPICIPERPLLFFATACLSPTLLALLSAPPSARMAAREGMASESHSGPWVSPRHSWACLWGKEEREGTLGGSPEKPILLADAQGLPFAL